MLKYKYIWLFAILSVDAWVASALELTFPFVGFDRDICRPVLPLLLLVGEHQLDVHARIEHPRRHRRDGPLRHQRLVRLPPVVGDPSRPVRRSPRKSQSLKIKKTQKLVINDWDPCGIQIVAVIFCNTGVALLAYMDGITRSPTLGGVALAASAAAGSAVYKVFVQPSRPCSWRHQ